MRAGLGRDDVSSKIQIVNWMGKSIESPIINHINVGDEVMHGGPK